jgi:hypothetical protein
MKKTFYISFILFLNISFAQTVFKVENISSNYFGKIYISDTTEVFSKGWVAIFDSKTKKQLIKVNSEELTFELHQGKVVANIKELPYGKQSQIMYEDYNLDGEKDFAVMDGQNSCYHGPSFQIYLKSPKGFILSDDYTALAQNYCGMFNVDAKNKKIFTMTKSGCCWHEFSEFNIVNHLPILAKVETISLENIVFEIQTVELWKGNKKTVKTTKTLNLDQEGITKIMSFKVDKNQQKIILFSINDEGLYYATINPKNEVAFSYPIEREYQKPNFKYNTQIKSLTFFNKNTQYTVYQNKSKTGIEIKTNHKTYFWDANRDSIEGSLLKIEESNFDNVVKE